MWKRYRASPKWSSREILLTVGAPRRAARLRPSGVVDAVPPAPFRCSATGGRGYIRAANRRFGVVFADLRRPATRMDISGQSGTRLLPLIGIAGSNRGETSIGGGSPEPSPPAQFRCSASGGRGYTRAARRHFGTIFADSHRSAARMDRFSNQGSAVDRSNCLGSKPRASSAAATLARFRRDPGLIRFVMNHP